jgi:hypothetical protein
MGIFPYARGDEASFPVKYSGSALSTHLKPVTPIDSMFQVAATLAPELHS